MFDLKRPCVTCPFRKGQGELFGLGLERLREIFEAPAFQCHKTVDYENFDDDRKRQGDKPQQCAGLMSLLAREGRDNQIMQVAQRLGHLDVDRLDHSDVYATINDAIAAHDWSRDHENHGGPQHSRPHARGKGRDRKHADARPRRSS